MTSTRRAGALFSACLLVLATGFTWGFLAHRQRLFPFTWLRAAALGLGVVRGDVRVSWRAAAGPRPGLEASPYLAGTFDPEARMRGVLVADPKRAMPGSTLVLTRSQGEPLALLAGLDGKPVWTWRLGAIATPQLGVLLADGDLLVLDAGQALVRLDRLGRVRWRAVGAFHHSLSLAGERILTLRSRPRVEPRVHPRAPVMDDEIVILDLDGRELEAVSILEALLASPQAFLLPGPSDEELGAIAVGRKLEELELDILHTNHVSLTAVADAGVEALARPGNYLISVRNLNLLAVLDGQSHAVLWAWGPGRLVQQHHPTLLPSGRLLVFNNGETRSEVLEVDPATRRVEWRYSADGFFTNIGGSCQRLANGNTLITESMTGHVLEVTSEGERVWVWANPDVSPEGIRQAVYRATRHGPEELGWLEGR